MVVFTVRDYTANDFFDVIRIYQSAFAEPPWNEFKKCTLCGINYGIQEVNNRAENCKKCSCPLALVEFWSQSDIQNDLAFALSQPFYRVLVAESGGLSGFVWGYKLPLFKFPFLEDKVNENAHYMDEIAVHANARRQGIGKLLGVHYLESVKKTNIPEVILRTDYRNTSSVQLFSSLGFEKIGVVDPEFDYRIYFRRRLS